MVSKQKGKSFPKPYQKEFFSKVNFKTWFPKMDTDGDGVPDWKDCEPFNPKKQDEEPEPDIELILDKIKAEQQQQEPEKVHIYLFNSDLNEWDYTGEYLNDKATQQMIEDLQRTFEPENVFIRNEFINPRKIGKKERFKDFKEKFSDYVEERDFYEHLKEGVQPREKVIKAYHKQAKPHIEGPRVTKDILERERELVWGRHDRLPWQPYNPVRKEQCFARAPWQDGIRWNANFRRAPFKPPYMRRQHG